MYLPWGRHKGGDPKDEWMNGWLHVIWLSLEHACRLGERHLMTIVSDAPLWSQ